MKGHDRKSTKTASLRWRLTAVSLAMLAVALVALDVAVYVALHQRYNSDLREKLSAAVVHIHDITFNSKESTQEAADVLSTQDVVAVVFRTGRYPVIGTPVPSDLPRLPAIVGAPVTPDDSWTRLQIAVNANSDLAWKTTYISKANFDSVLFVTSKKPMKAALGRLLVAELIGTLLVLVLAVLIVSVVVRLTLRPLDRMAAVAGRITAGDLRQRLRPSRPWTELGRLATALDAMLDSLADSLVSERRAREHANRSEERMRDFLSDASHELRTPIAGLQWSAEALLRQGNERKRREELAFQIARQASRASKLVADLLSMALLDQGVTLERERFDLAELAKEELDRVRELEPRLELTLSGESECRLVADAERVRQVVSNLIDNARKMIDGRGKIEVRVRRNGVLAELEVKDSGPGVPESDREHIFERFVRLDDSRRRSEPRFGSGLGLSIARSIAEAHGGGLVCVASDAGARFVLTLPLGEPAKRPVPVRPKRVKVS